MLGSPEMAVVKPFRAERYDERSAGPLERLVAPPYDVISPEERSELLARSPYNVVHLTLPDTEEEAGAAIADWRRHGVLARDEEPAFWFLSQDYVGPDGVARNRSGLVASLRAEPYENRVVLPHERTHSGPRKGGCGSSARPGPSSNRSSSSTKAIRSSGPRGSLTCKAAATSFGGSALRRTSSRRSC